MRTREEILKSKVSGALGWADRGQMYNGRDEIIEVLLDIRELLARPGVQNDFGRAKEEEAGTV